VRSARCETAKESLVADFGNDVPVPPPSEGRAQPGKRDRNQRVDAVEDCERKQAVGAETDKGLLADGDQPCEARKQVPVLREAEHGEHEEQVLQQPSPGDERHGDK
jgi:hypothetical protein